MKFNYQARTQKGEIKTGVLEASSKEAAIEILGRYNLVVTSIETEGGEPIYAKSLEFFAGVSQKEIAVFTRQLSILFGTGVPLVEALRALTKQSENSGFREKILHISNDVDGGTPLSRALALYPNIFSKFYINMVHSAEISGNLSGALDYLAEHLEREYHLTSKIRSSMFYPAFLVFGFVMVVIVMMVFVIPKLTVVLQETGQELPLVTRIIVDSSNFLADSIIFLAILTVVLAVGVWRFAKTSTGNLMKDRVMLRLPIFGAILRKMYLARFSENLATLIKGGIPIASALSVVGEVVGNNVFRNIIFEARDAVRRGENISSVFARHPQVPPLVVQMIAVGEKTGKIDSVLMDLAHFYQKEIDSLVDNLVSLIEPILVVGLGIFVGILAVAILLPIYNLAGGF